MSHHGWTTVNSEEYLKKQHDKELASGRYEPAYGRDTKGLSPPTEEERAAGQRRREEETAAARAAEERAHEHWAQHAPFQGGSGRPQYQVQARTNNQEGPVDPRRDNRSGDFHRRVAGQFSWVEPQFNAGHPDYTSNNIGGRHGAPRGGPPRE
ncbi:hypothetical protein JCM10213_007461 [Rhodosporidiobolus nylandii]